MDNVGCFANSGSIWDSISEWNVSICSVSDIAMIARTSVKPQGTGMSSSSGAIGSRPPDQGYSASGSTERRSPYWGLIKMRSSVGMRDTPGRNSLSSTG